MALSKEIEVILRADARSARAAIMQIERAARKQSNDVAGKATQAALEGYADKLGTTAATLVSKALDTSSRALHDSMLDTVTKASVSLSTAIRTAMEETNPQLQGEQLRNLKKQMQAFENLTSDEVQKAMAISVKDAFSADNLSSAVGEMSNTFEKALNGIDVNDLGGFVKSLGGAVGKGLGALSGRAKAGEVAATAAGDAAGAAQLAELATVLSTTAVAFAGLGAAVALFLSFVKATDDYQAKLNKTLLDGASVADIMGVAYQEGGRNLLTLSETMGAARKAAVDTAVAFRMTTEETANVLQELNSAGITYKRIIDGASTAQAAQQRFADAISQTITYASLLGVSVSELATYQNTLMKDVNLSLDRTFDVFSAINEASMASGMATKTFFTAISQATSGMALYNVRIDQAIGLIKEFGKIVGEADAGKVLGELTQKKDVDTRLRDAAMAVETIGIDAVHQLFRDTTEADATEFQKSFQENRKEILKVFKDAKQAELGEKLMSEDAKIRNAAVDALAKLDPATREQIKAGLTPIQGGAASRAFGSMAGAALGTTGDLDVVAGQLNQLDMVSKLELLDKSLRGLMAEQGKTLAEVITTATGQKFLGAVGVNEDQMEPLMRANAYLEAARRVQQPGGATGTDIGTLTQAGFTVDSDKVTTNAGKEISDVGDILRGMGVSMESADAAEARRVAGEKQRMTGTITEALNAWVQGSLFEGALNPGTGTLEQILKWVSGGAYDPEKAAAEKAAKTKAVTEAQANLEAAQQAVTAAGEDPAMQALAAQNLAQAEQNVAAATAGAKLGAGPFTAETAVGVLSGQDANAVKAAAQAYKDAHAAAENAVTIGDMGMSSRNMALDAQEATAKAEFESLLSTQLAGAYQASIVGDQVQATPVQDAFISKDGAMYRGPSADNILMFKDGGPLDPRTGGGGGNVVININGGDQAMVYRTVARAMRAAQG